MIVLLGMTHVGLLSLEGCLSSLLKWGIEWEVDFWQKRKAGSSKLIDSFSGLL
jgi:hypothetical protein